MTLGTFQAVRLQREPGAKAGCRALEDGGGQEGEPEASGAERAGYSYHRQSFESATHKTATVVDTVPVSFTGETALSRSFGRSEGNGTSQLLVFIRISR